MNESKIIIIIETFLIWNFNKKTASEEWEKKGVLQWQALQHKLSLPFWNFPLLILILFIYFTYFRMFTVKKLCFNIKIEKLKILKMKIEKFKNWGKIENCYLLIYFFVCFCNFWLFFPTPQILKIQVQISKTSCNCAWTACKLCTYNDVSELWNRDLFQQFQYY